jgi:hypothetical protein
MNDLDFERDRKDVSMLYAIQINGRRSISPSFLVLKKLGFFQPDPSRLDEGQWEASTPVPRAIFADFVRLIVDDSMLLTEDNSLSLQRLRDEFDFRDLSGACEAFTNTEAHRQALRLLNLAERHRALERGLCRANDRTKALEGDLLRALTTEQDYRQGCECLFGTDSFKRAADSSHSEGKFLYGESLMRGAAASSLHADGYRTCSGRRLPEMRGRSTPLGDSLMTAQGDARRQFKFGRCLESCLGVCQDFVWASEFCRLSAAQGNAPGPNALGHPLGERERSLSAAADLYAQSAAQRNDAGQCNSGRCLE